jgi:hypothetical protein
VAASAATACLRYLNRVHPVHASIMKSAPLPTPAARTEVMTRSGGFTPMPFARLAAALHTLDPAWRGIAGGCRLNRTVDDPAGDAGFRLNDLRTRYARGPRPMAFTYKERARLQ